MLDLFEELGLHVVVVGLVEVDAAFAEEAGVGGLGGEEGFGVGVGGGSVGFGELFGDGGAGFGFDAVVGAVDGAPIENAPAEEGDAPFHTGVGVDAVAEDAVGGGGGVGDGGV